MPVLGTRPSEKRLNGKGYLKDPICKLTESFLSTAQNILNENSVDIFRKPDIAFMRGTTSRDDLKRFFCENSCDVEHMDAEEVEDHMQMMEEQFENDCEGMVLNEYASMNTFNPVIGMMFPIHKNLLMNCIFDKGAIPKVVLKSPKETVSMETRWLVTPKGEKIDLYRDQRKISNAVQSTNPFVEVPVILPETGTTDVLAAIGGSSLDNLSIETSISAIMIAEDNSHKLSTAVSNEDKEAALAAGTWIDVDMQFVTSYMDYDRSVIDHVSYEDPTTHDKKQVVISATMKENKFQVVDMQGNALAVKIKARLDSSNAMLDTCKVDWSVRTDLIEIGPGIPINVPISPEEVKDIGALYQVNQLTKIMSMIKLVMENTKDDDIKNYLDESFVKMPKTDKIHRVFDFAPREGYMLDHVEWRHKTFLDAFDTYVTDMLTVLNDPNMTVTVFGRPDIIRKIVPTEYSFQSPSNIGPVELEFTQTVVTSDKRVYKFMSSTKLNGTNELIIVLCPRNSDRIIYRIFDYQMYVSNEIRNAANPSLPAIHAFQRYKVWSYQPVQGRVEILNPTGLKNTYDSLGFAGV